MPAVGKFEGRLEPGEAAGGLPPPERPWAQADVLNAKMKKAQRKNGVFMTHPQTLVTEYMPFVERSRHFLSRFGKDFTYEIGVRPVNDGLGKRPRNRWGRQPKVQPNLIPLTAF